MSWLANKQTNSNGTLAWWLMYSSHPNTRRPYSYLHATFAFGVVIERKDSSLWWPHKLLARAKAHGRHGRKEVEWDTYGEGNGRNSGSGFRFSPSSWLSLSFFFLRCCGGWAMMHATWWERVNHRWRLNYSRLNVIWGRGGRSHIGGRPKDSYGTSRGPSLSDLPLSRHGNLQCLLSIILYGNTSYHYWTCYQIAQPSIES